MRSATLVSVLLSASLLGTGCGGEPSPEDIVSTAISGLSEGDSKQVCDQLTAGAEREILALLADNPLGFPDIKAKTCAEGVGKLHDALSKAQRAVLADGEVAEAEVSGDKATVRVVGAGMQAELERVEGRWMITGGLFK